MSSIYPPLTCKEVKTILKNLGFRFKKQKGSHEQWVKEEKAKFYKVTVDCPKEPFTGDLIKYMAARLESAKRNFIGP